MGDHSPETMSGNQFHCKKIRNTVCLDIDGCIQKDVHGV